MDDQGRHDRGLLGSDSVAWSVIGHPGSLVGGLRALMVQSLHPLAMAGVAQHSDYRMRALDRLRRTAYYVTATVFGDLATANAAAERVRRIHSRVRGVDPVSGRPYSADDPDTQVWVHSVEWHSFLAAYRAFGPPLGAPAQDRYISEGVVIAELVGTPRALVPDSVGAMRSYFQRVRRELRVCPASRDAIDFVLHPPLTRELLAVQVPLRVFANAALALVPRDLRRLAGVDRARALDLAALAAARPLVSSMVLPGVREVTALVLGGEVRRVREQALRGHGRAQGTVGPERAAA